MQSYRCSGTLLSPRITAETQSLANLEKPHLTNFGKGAGAKSCSEWSPTWRGDLASTISGGQWTQARKARVSDWGITDSRCQLCMQAVGTLEHRFSCASATPSEGWPGPPKAAIHLLGRLSARRKNLLSTRGLLVLRLPAPIIDAVTISLG